jgi:hypothetical protein
MIQILMGQGQPPTSSNDTFGSNTMAARDNAQGGSPAITPMDMAGRRGANTMAAQGQQPTVEQMLSIMGQQAATPNASTSSTAGAPPGGYVHNGAIFDAMGRLVGYTNDGGGGAPSSINQGDQQVRIGDNRRMRGGAKGQGQGSTRRSGFASSNDSPERRQWFSDTQAALNARAQDKRENYGFDYGRAAAAAYLLRQAGIRPLDVQQSARRAASGAYGV